jgi:hypothetical protein
MLTVKQYAKSTTIPQSLLRNAQLTVNIVNEVFEQFPNQFTFNSGYRTPAHNAAVGGAPNSYHVQALAADITPKNGNYNQYKSALTAIVAKYGWEVVDERNKNHFHLEPSGTSSPSGASAPSSTGELLDIGLVGTVDIPFPEDEKDIFDNIAKNFNVSRNTAIAGSLILGLLVFRNL